MECVWVVMLSFRNETSFTTALLRVSFSLLFRHEQARTLARALAVIAV